MKCALVKQGDEIGLSGDIGGCSAGVHVHVELLINDNHTSWLGKTIDGWTVAEEPGKELVSSNQDTCDSTPCGGIGGLVKVSGTEDRVEGALVKFDVGGVIRNKTTDESGSYFFSSVPAGGATIKASHPTYGVDSKPVTVLADSSTQAPDLLLSPQICPSNSWLGRLGLLFSALGHPS